MREPTRRRRRSVGVLAAVPDVELLLDARALRKRTERRQLCSACGDGVGHCHHDDPALDEIDREWATADEARRALLLEAMRELAAKYGARVRLLVRRSAPGEPN